MRISGRLAAGFEAKLRTRTDRQKVGVIRVMEQSGERAGAMLFDLSPVDTQFMRDHTRVKHTDFGYEAGWFPEDFIGAFNKVTEKVITVFYPPFPVLGTRFIAGNDPRVSVAKAEFPILRENLRAVLA